MAYSYCARCDHPFDRAPLADALNQVWVACPNGHANPCNVTPEDANIELVERLEALETAMGISK